MDGPKPAHSSGAALRYLPQEKEAAAREGKYLIAPGVRLGDPWKDNRSLKVEPLTEDWKAGDTIRIVAGPQTYQALARHVLQGDYLPQDQVGGMGFGNRGNRIANFPGITIGNPGWAGFREGILINLDRDGYGDGLVISAATGWDEAGLEAGNSGVHRAAIVVPENLPAMVGEHHWKVPHLRWRLADEDPSGAIEIARDNGDALATFHQDGSTIKTLAVTEDLAVGGTITGNAKTRGTATFDGDGKQTRFVVPFQSTRDAAPVVVFNTNQFARSRLQRVAARSFTVEFEEAPPAGEGNVTIWWLAQH